MAPYNYNSMSSNATLSRGVTFQAEAEADSLKMAINRKGRGNRRRQRTPTPPPPPADKWPPDPSPPPSRPATPVIEPAYDPMWFRRDEINELFYVHGLSFADPNQFVTLLVRMRLDSEAGGVALGDTPHDRIMEIIGEIAGSEGQHRHWVDAVNIIREYERRVQGQPDRRLVPDPQLVNFNYVAPRKLKIFKKGLERIRNRRRDAEPTSDEEGEVGQEIVPPMLDKYLPLPRVRFYPEFDDDNTWATVTPEFVNNATAIRWLDKFTDNPGARAAVLNILSTRGNDRGLDPPPIMRDDPLEMVLRLPEQMPLIDGATPATDPGRQNEANWPLVEVYDSRASGASRRLSRRLLQTNYITRFVAAVRRMVVNPEVAKKYAIIFRAHPSRYQDNTTEELADEGPPTTAEVECVIDFFSMAFPVIDIVRTLKDQSGNPRVHAEVDRETNPNLIEINGLHFDAIESGLLEGINIGHYFYFLLATIVHELGHYFYGCIYYGQRLGSRGQRVKPFPYLPDLDIRFDPLDHPEFDPDAWPTPWPPAPDGRTYRLDTPRRLRLGLDGVGRASVPRALTQYDRTATWGEMGEIIEWLVFGFLSQIDIDGDPSNTYSIICWGSSSLNPDQQVKFGGYVGTRLYTARPPVRMEAEQMRFYVTNVKREELVYLEAERAARRVFQAAVVQVGVDAANALGDAERLRVYGTAPGVAQPELFRLRPQNAFMYQEYPPAQDDDDEDEEMGDAAEDAGGRDRMEIDLESDPDEHYTSRQIPRSQGRRKAKRYHECVRRVNVEAHRRGNFKKAIQQEQLNNPDPVPQFELAVPSSMFPRLVWEGLRLFLALSLPLGFVWAFQVDFDQIGGSEVWFIAYVCCFSLPLHTTRWLFSLASQTAVQSGHLFALILALVVYCGLPATIPQLSLVDEWSGVLLPGLLVLASWRVWWQLLLIVVDQLGWFAMQLLFSSEILRWVTAWLLRE